MNGKIFFIFLTNFLYLVAGSVPQPSPAQPSPCLPPGSPRQPGPLLLTVVNFVSR